MEFNDFYLKKWDYNKRYKLYEFIFGKEKLTDSITYLEFGVAGGLSFKWWVSKNQNPNSTRIAYLSNAPETIAGIELLKVSHETFLRSNDFPKGELFLRKSLSDQNHKIDSIR